MSVICVISLAERDDTNQIIHKYKNLIKSFDKTLLLIYERKCLAYKFERIVSINLQSI